jgi:8-oxo-dGTP pyrophosphatase MutT (NUDIX family)
MTNPELTLWQVLDTRLLLDCSPWFRVVADDVLLPDGRRIEGFHRIEALDFVMVFPLTDDSRVLALQGYKHGVGRVMYQLPAGYMDRAGESALTCAQRELLEETGYTAREWQALGSLSVDGNRGMGRAWLFLARELHAAAARPESDDLETLAIKWLPLDQVHQRWRAGEFDNAAASALIGLALDVLRSGHLQSESKRRAL